MLLDVRTVGVNDVIAAIDEAKEREPGGVLAFDGDGTLWTGDVGEDYFAALLDHGLHRAAHEELAREAAAANIDASGTASDIARRIHAAYLSGAFPEERVCEIMSWVAAGWSREQLGSFCEEVLDAVGLSDRLHAEAVRVVEHARRVGIDVFIVSASPHAVVECAARIVGIEPTNAIAVTERCDEMGVVQCFVERPIPYGDGKVTRLRARVGDERVLYAAFGDNSFDVPMLRAARLPVAIRPKPRLVARASELPNLLLLSEETADAAG